MDAYLAHHPRAVLAPVLNIHVLGRCLRQARVVVRHITQRLRHQGEFLLSFPFALAFRSDESATRCAPILGNFGLVAFHLLALVARLCRLASQQRCCPIRFDVCMVASSSDPTCCRNAISALVQHTKQRIDSSVAIYLAQLEDERVEARDGANFQSLQIACLPSACIARHRATFVNMLQKTHVVSLRSGCTR